MSTHDADPARALRGYEPRAVLQSILLGPAGEELEPDEIQFLRDLAELAFVLQRIDRSSGRPTAVIRYIDGRSGNGRAPTVESPTVEELEGKVDRVSADLGELAKEHNILQGETHAELDRLSRRMERAGRDLEALPSALEFQALRERLEDLEAELRRIGEE